jgi:hypothetical protein
MLKIEKKSLPPLSLSLNVSISVVGFLNLCFSAGKETSTHICERFFWRCFWWW